MSAEVATINGRLPGDGACVATQCGASIREGALMCRTHWKRLPRGLRHRMRHEWAMWGHGLSTLGDLRYVQRECVHALDRLDAEQQP